MLWLSSLAVLLLLFGQAVASSDGGALDGGGNGGNLSSDELQLDQLDDLDLSDDLMLNDGGGSAASAGTLIGLPGGGGAAGAALGGLGGVGGGLKLEQRIAAVFNKVAYGSTTTKRSIPDNVFVPSLTTVATPPLTTYR